MQFLIIAYDYDDAFERRMQSREQHIINTKKMMEEIDTIENELGSEFDYGVTLVDVDDWEEFVEQDLKDLGYIPKDFPSWIEIDWEATANNVRQDYTEVEYQGNSYLGRI